MQAAAGRERLESPVSGYDFVRSGVGVSVIAQFGLDEGVGIGALFAGTGLSPDALDDPSCQVTPEQELRVIRNMISVLGDRPGVGLELGRRYRITTFGIFGFACLTSPTVRDALRFALGYFDLTFSFCVPRIEVSGGVATARVDDSAVPADLRPFLLERDLAAIITVMRDFYTPGIDFTDVSLRNDPPADVGPYVDLFGTAPRFAAQENALTFDAAVLSRALPQASAVTRARCEAQCRAIVSGRRGSAPRRSPAPEPEGFAAAVRERLVRIDTAAPDQIELAADLGVSVRTLRRRLADNGTSYRELLDEVREGLSEHLLETGALSVEDVALRLGYAESASFIRAFTRWKGVTPARYRSAGKNPGHTQGVRTDRA